MATLEFRNGWYRLLFRFAGQRFTHSLHTQDERIAEALRGTVDRTILLIQQRLLTVPANANLKEFIISGGSQVAPTHATIPSTSGVEERDKQNKQTLGAIRDRYRDTLAIGAVEANTLKLIELHFRHWVKSLGVNFRLDQLTQSDLQDHVNRRSKAKGIRGRALSPVTIRKELSTLRACWNWSVHSGLLKGAFPNKGLKFSKTTQKHPFQTWEEIEREIAQGGMSKAEIADLWSCLFLGKAEIAELIEYVRVEGGQPWIYPMVAFAAHTGARRSEIIRTRIADIDLEQGVARIHEKKRSHGKLTHRRVPLSPPLIAILSDWLKCHPGGPWLFAQRPEIERSKTVRKEALAVTKDEAQDHFHRTMRGSKWKVLKGWHVLRHSFISVCASEGVDQRLLLAWVGHMTAEMQSRYTHLYPSVERKVMEGIFGLAKTQPVFV